MIAFLKANTAYSLKSSISGTTAKTLIIIGGRENREIQQSAKTISQAIRDSQIMVMPGLYHGEFSINQPERYMQTITKMLEEWHICSIMPRTSHRSGRDSLCPRLPGSLQIPESPKNDRVRFKIDLWSKYWTGEKKTSFLPGFWQKKVKIKLCEAVSFNRNVTIRVSMMYNLVL